MNVYGELNGILTPEGQIGGGLIVPNDPDVILFEGPYEVSSKAFVSQTFATTGKLMSKDFEVLQVPYREEVNSAGGITVFIAEDI